MADGPGKRDGGSLCLRPPFSVFLDDAVPVKLSLVVWWIVALTIVFVYNVGLFEVPLCVLWSCLLEALAAAAYSPKSQMR